MASIHISEQISNGNFDGNKVIQLWNLTFLVQCIFLNVGISLLCCVIHSPPAPLWPPPHAPFMKFFISPIPWVAVVPSSPPRRVVRRGLIKYFLLYYRGNDSATDHHRPRDCRVSTDGRTRRRRLPQWSLHCTAAWAIAWYPVCGGPQISDVIQSLKSAERKWITLPIQLRFSSSSAAAPRASWAEDFLTSPSWCAVL